MGVCWYLMRGKVYEIFRDGRRVERTGIHRSPAALGRGTRDGLDPRKSRGYVVTLFTSRSSSMHTAAIRSFIALYPDAGARGHMAAYIAALAERLPAVKWEKESQIHITLKFLGDQEAATLNAIARELDVALRGSGIVEEMLDHVGAFPNARRPRIIWTGFATPPQRILALQRAVEDVCAAHGIMRDDKRFTPHFTIGRVKDSRDAGDLENELRLVRFMSTSVTSQAVRVMESTLTPRGAIHKERASINLQPGE